MRFYTYEILRTESAGIYSNPDISERRLTDITQEVVKVIKSIYYERFRHLTTACDAILLDWFDLPQQPDELSVFGFSGAGGSRPTLSGFVMSFPYSRADVGMDRSQLGSVGRLLAH